MTARTLSERIARRKPCSAVHANGDRCARTEAHGLDDFHQWADHVWAFRGLPWKQQIGSAA